jgi:meiotically up-regulated gene 157 (Mug157) protein
MREQQRTDGPGPYHFIRGKKKPGDDGYGAPMKPTGMICSMFRNSDDQTTYLFNIPENLFAVTSLRQLAEMSEAMMPSDSLGREGRALADEAEKGIREYGTVTDSHGQKKYAYECDGLGNTLLMEDPGIPGLVSISYLDPTVINDPLVLASRRWALSPNDPFYSHGMFAEGTWSPHVGKGHIWPMGIIMRAMTSNDDAEITLCLAMLKTSSAGTGFMHESFDQDNPSKYTRHWFAWVNNLYGELILKLLRERPALLAKPVPSPSP